MLLSLTLIGCGGNESDYDPLEGVETQMVLDDSGRDEVEIPAEITKIAPSGATATMMLTPIASDLMVGIAASPSVDQEKYLPEELLYLPTFGQFYGSKSTLNMEALIEAEPQVIFDLGDKKVTVKADMDSIGKQTGIPALFYDGTLEHMADTYRTLGKLLGREERGEEIAEFIDRTVDMAERNSAKISAKDKITILYGTGATGLAVNAQFSSQAQVIPLIGAKNAIIPEEITDKGGGTIVSMESLYEDEPDMIILTEGGPYEELQDNEWSELKAVKTGRYYKYPVTRTAGCPTSFGEHGAGLWWLASWHTLMYITTTNGGGCREYYKLFWNYDLSDKEAKAMLSNSYFKNENTEKE